MKFPRNARIFQGQLDAAPFASVFFLLVIFMLLASLLYTPGVHVQLPVTDGLTGTDRPTIAVAVDADGRLYFENQLVSTNDLANNLRAARQNSPEALTLIVQADKAVAEEQLIHIALLARDAGIQDLLLATLPRAFASNSIYSASPP
jgi:biopolymer transport protein ExbD